jgi:hypothetical protein
MCGVMDWSGCAQKAATSALEAMAEAFADAVAWVVVESFTWWIDTDSAGLNTGVVDRIRGVTWPLTLTVAAAGIIVLGIQMARTGRADPLLSLGEGIARLVIWTVSGVMILNAFMKYAGAFSGWVLDSAKTRELGARLSGAYGDSDVSLGAVIILSLIGFVAGVAQWLIGLFREAAVVILAGCLPLAAAGHLFNQGWERRIVGWCMALIWWQPCAALVYFAAYAMMQEARGGQDMLVGLTMLIIAVIALPALMKLFSWVTDQHGQGRLLGSGGGGAGRAVAAGAGARMSLTSMTRLVSSGLPSPGRPGGAGAAGSAGAAPGGGGGGLSGAAPGHRTAPIGAPSTGSSAPAGAVPASRTSSSTPGGATTGAPPGGGALPAGTATAVAGAASPGGAAVPTAGTGAAAGSAAGVGAAGGGTAAAAGAKGAALGGPVGAAAAVTAAGAGAAGRAMTEPPTRSAEGSGSSPKSDSKEGTS